MLTVKAITVKTTQILQEHTHCHAQIKLFQLFLLHQCFQYIAQLIYQLIFSSTDNFHSLDIHQHHMIYHIHTHSYLDSM